MRWTITRQILAGYIVSLLFLVVLGLVVFKVSKDMFAAFEERRQSNLVIAEAARTLSLLQDAETGQRGFIITGADRYLEPYTQATEQLPDALEQLRRITVAAGRDGSSISSLQTAIENKLDELKETIDLRRSSGFEAAVAVINGDTGKKQMDRIRGILDTIKSDEQKASAASNERAKAGEAVIQKLILIGVPVCAIVMLAAGILTARSISRPVHAMATAAGRIAEGDLGVAIPRDALTEEIQKLAKSFTAMVASLRQSASLSERIASGDLTVKVAPQSDLDIVGQAQQGMVGKLSELVEQVQRSGVQVNSSAVQIAATSKQQQSTATEMASTTTEISATAKEMSATAAELLKAADSVNAVSQQLSSLAASGKEGIERMGAIMKQITEASSSITTRFGEMNDKAGNIGSVVTTITKIADQTNLLSLNAAIEAEKAGEYGRGFSVVASEIRRLADQTAASTLDIEQMIKEMIASVSAGVMGMDKFSEEVRRSGREVAEVSSQIDQMIEEAQSLAPSVESVYEGMRAQTQGATQISDALAQLGDAARQTADSVRDSNRAVEQLNEATRGLQTAIARFKLR